MLIGLLRNFVSWLFGRKSRPKPPPPRPPASRPSPLGLESLEDRRLFSADTTVPSLLGASALTANSTLFMASLPRVEANIVFLGDSITWGYQYGLGSPVWDAALAGIGGADYGVIGATTQSLLYQLSLGQLYGFPPSVIVLTIGTNNLLEGDGPDATAAGILADVAQIHQDAPEAQVLVLGVPPGAANPNDPYRVQVSETNALVDQLLLGDPQATFVNIAPAFENSAGWISNQVMFDFIHPTALGYARMTVALVTPITDAFLKSLPFPVAF